MRLLFLLLNLVLALPATAEVRKVMVLPAQGTAPDTDQRDVFAQLRAAFAGVEGFGVVSVARTLSELEAAADMGLKCRPEDTECLARLALVMPADRLVVPTLDSTDDGALTLRLDVYDAATAGLLQRVERTLPPVGSARVPVLQEAAALLLAPERYVGALVVTVVAPFTSASLDGAEAQQGPEARFDSVTAGAHILTAYAGERSISQTVEILPGEVVRVAIGGGSTGGAADEAEPGAAWWLAAGLGVAAGGSVVFLGAAGASAFLLSDLFATGAVFGQSPYEQRQAALAVAYASGGVAVVGLACMVGGVALAAVGPLF